MRETLIVVAAIFLILVMVVALIVHFVMPSGRRSSAKLLTTKDKARRIAASIALTHREALVVSLHFARLHVVVGEVTDV